MCRVSSQDNTLHYGFLVVNMSTSDLANMPFNSQSIAKKMSINYFVRTLSKGAPNIMFLVVLKRTRRIAGSVDIEIFWHYVKRRGILLYFLVLNKATNIMSISISGL